MKSIVNTDAWQQWLKKLPAQPLGLGCLLAMSMGANALPLLNGGFESGDLREWTVNAPLYPLYYDSSCPELGISGYAPEGTAGVMPGTASAAEGWFYAALFQNDVGGPGRETGVPRSLTLSRDIALQAGQRVFGHATGSYEDYLPCDAAWISILNPTGSSLATPWMMRSAGADGYDYPVRAGDVPLHGWVPWEWVAPAAGIYTLQFGVGSADDGLFGSNAYFDGIEVSSVPDAGSTLALLLGSLMGLGWVSLRRGKA